MGGDRHPDGVETYPATLEDLATYTQARAQLAAFKAPVLVDGQRTCSYQPGQARLCGACGGLAIQFDPSLHSVSTLPEDGAAASVDDGRVWEG